VLRQRGQWERGANAPDHPGGEVFLDAIGRSRGRCAQKPGFELLTVGAVIDPVPRRRNPFARRDYRRVADHGHEFSMPARLRSQYAEAVLDIVERDSLDETRQHLLGRWFRLRLHSDCGVIYPATSPHGQNRYLAVCEHLIYLAAEQKAPERAAAMRGHYD